MEILWTLLKQILQRKYTALGQSERREGFALSEVIQATKLQ
jgi:hypothetical protein